MLIMAENDVNMGPGVVGIKNWTGAGQVSAATESLGDPLAVQPAPTSPRATQPFTAVPAQQLSIPDNIGRLRPEGRRSRFRRIPVLRLPLPAAPQPPSPTPSPLPQVPQQSAPLTAATPRSAKPATPNAVLTDAKSQSPPKTASRAMLVPHVWTPLEGVPERALPPPSQSPAPRVVPKQCLVYTPIEGVPEMRGLGGSAKLHQWRNSCYAATVAAAARSSASSLTGTDDTPQLRSGRDCAPSVQQTTQKGPSSRSRNSRLSTEPLRTHGALALAGFGLTVLGFGGLTPGAFESPSSNGSQEESPVEGLLEGTWEERPGLSRLADSSNAAAACMQASDISGGFSFGNVAASKRGSPDGSESNHEGGAPTVLGPQPPHYSHAAASPALSPIFAGLLRNRWTSHSASPAPTAALPQAHPQATSIKSAAHARQSVQDLHPADVASAVPCATTPPLAEAAASAPVRDEQCTQAAATDGAQDGYPSNSDDYDGGDDGGWCGSGDEGNVAGSTLPLKLRPPAAAASPSGGDTAATPPGLMPTVATPETRPVDDSCDQVSTGAQVDHSEQEAPAHRHRAAKAHKNERLRRQFQARKSLAGDGMVNVLGTNQKPRRRSTRATHQPLRFELGEHKRYERNHKSMPTVASFVYVEDKPFWPGPTPPVSSAKRPRSKAAPSKQPAKKSRMAQEKSSTSDRSAPKAVAAHKQKPAANVQQRGKKSRCKEAVSA